MANQFPILWVISIIVFARPFPRMKQPVPENAMVVAYVQLEGDKGNSGGFDEPFGTVQFGE